MSIMKHVTLQKIVAHDFRYVPRTYSIHSYLRAQLSVAPLPPSATSDSRLSSQSVPESSVITPDIPPLPTCTTFYTFSPSALSSTDLLSNFSLTAPHTPKPLVGQTGNYTIADLSNVCRPCKHKHTNHIVPYLTGSRGFIWFRILHFRDLHF